MSQEIEGMWSKEAAELLQLSLTANEWGSVVAQVPPRSPCCRDKTHSSQTRMRSRTCYVRRMCLRTCDCVCPLIWRCRNLMRVYVQHKSLSALNVQYGALLHAAEMQKALGWFESASTKCYVLLVCSLLPNSWSLSAKTVTHKKIADRLCCNNYLTSYRTIPISCMLCSCIVHNIHWLW